MGRRITRFYAPLGTYDVPLLIPADGKVVAVVREPQIGNYVLFVEHEQPGSMTRSLDVRLCDEFSDIPEGFEHLATVEDPMLYSPGWRHVYAREKP